MHVSKQWVEIVFPDLARRLDRTVEKVAAAVIVVGLAYVSVRQHRISLLHRPKARCRISGGVFVGMQGRRFLAKRFFDIGQRRSAAESKGGVVVCHVSASFSVEPIAVGSYEMRRDFVWFDREVAAKRVTRNYARPADHRGWQAALTPTPTAAPPPASGAVRRAPPAPRHA